MDSNDREMVRELVAMLTISVGVLNDLAKRSESPEFPLTGMATELIGTAMEAITAAEENQRPAGFYL